MSAEAAAASTLPAAALAASRAALNAALADPSSAAPLSIVTTPHPQEADEDSADVESAGQTHEGSDGVEQSGDAQEVLTDMPQFDEMRTIFSDPNNFNVKHPLYSAWTLWFDSPATKGRNLPPTPATPTVQAPFATPQTPGAHVGGGWMDDIKRVITFDSVEEFWGVYNNMVPPSQLPQKANYYLFKEGIIPAWEDDANKHGGKWSIQFPKDKNRANIDKMWLYTMLAAIGETFDPALMQQGASNSDTTLITGVIVSSRPQFYRISIWTRLAPTFVAGSEDDKLRERIESIGKHFKTAVLGYTDGQKLAGALATEVEFASHKDSEKKGRSNKKLIA